ncbi:hypothetical protein C2U69_16255 [Cupriavidus pinatubonensis]|nr:hypothetical protein C2U69_16255 [Cupriavidus pinatubonensis]
MVHCTISGNAGRGRASCGLTVGGLGPALRRQAEKTPRKRPEQRAKFPANRPQTRISGFFRCIGATGDCPRREGQIRLRRSMHCLLADTSVTSTNKGNQP